MTRSRKRRYWSPRETERLVRLYPEAPTARIARLLGRPVNRVYEKANALGLTKSALYMRDMLASTYCQLAASGAAHRFKPGQIPHNKGIKGWQAGGRSAETRFKQGNVSARWDPEIYQVGALRLNSYGYVDMKIKQGLRAWRAFHVILWEDAHGPVPSGFCLRFSDGDALNIELDNLKLISRVDNMRLNTLHRYPEPIVRAYQSLGALRRQINRREKHERQNID